MVRGVWTYNMVKLDSLKGWVLINQTILIMYFFALMFYFFKPKADDCGTPMSRNGPFYGMVLQALHLCYII